MNGKKNPPTLIKRFTFLGEIGRQMFPLVMRRMCKQKEEGY